jgi:hypothetical protein
MRIAAAIVTALADKRQFSNSECRDGAPQYAAAITKLRRTASLL